MPIIATIAVTLVSALFVATAVAPVLIELTSPKQRKPDLVLLEGGIVEPRAPDSRHAA